MVSGIDMDDMRAVDLGMVDMRVINMRMIVSGGG